MKMRLAVLALLVATSPAWGETPRAGAEPESDEKGALAMVITTWDADCSGSTRNSWDNMVAAWYSEISNPLSPPVGHGSRAWWQDGVYVNGDIDDPDFCDEHQVAWGKDEWQDRVDEPDVLMVGLHGGHTGEADRWYGKVRVDADCGTTCNCKAYQGHIVLDYDLEFLHLSSCHSMCEKNWDEEWPDSFDGLHQVNGFHGVMWISTGLTDEYRDFADDAFDIAIAEAWVDNLYKANFSNGYDQCPVSFAAGRGEGSAETRMRDTTYRWVFDDPHDPTWFVQHFVSGCNPQKEPPLP